MVVKTLAILTPHRSKKQQKRFVYLPPPGSPVDPHHCCLAGTETTTQASISEKTVKTRLVPTPGKPSHRNDKANTRHARRGGFTPAYLRYLTTSPCSSFTLPICVTKECQQHTLRHFYIHARVRIRKKVNIASQSRQFI